MIFYDDYFKGFDRTRYKFFFSTIDLIDRLVDTFFNNNGVLIFDLNQETDTNNLYKEWQQFVFDTLIKRIEIEHRIDLPYTSLVSNTPEPSLENGVIKIDISKWYIERRNQIKENYIDVEQRQTGTSTKLANCFIQEIFNKPKERILVEDHYYDWNNRSRGFRGPTRADRDLYDKIRRRIDREFPYDIKEHIMFNRENYLMLDFIPEDTKINYHNFEL